MSVEPALTAREREMLSLVAAGLTSKAIAARLSLSHGTVRNRLTLIYAKLGVASRTEAAVLFVRGTGESSRATGT